MVQLSTSVHATRETIALTIQTFVSKVMSLLFNVLSRLVIAFLPRTKRLYFGGGGSKITADGDCSHEIKRCLLLVRKAMTNLDSVLKKQRHYFTDKGPYCQSYGFSSRHVGM